MSDTVGGKNELSAIKAPLFREVKKGETRRHIISVLVRNELGVLARIATLIAGKGYNIEGIVGRRDPRERLFFDDHRGNRRRRGNRAGGKTVKKAHRYHKG
jgi:hypothetical protein